MPLARARYDLILKHGDGLSARQVPAVVDMLEERDVGPDGNPGRLRAAKLERFDAPPGFHIRYERRAIGGRPRYCLLLNGWAQRHFAKDQRWLRWVDDPVE